VTVFGRSNHLSISPSHPGQLSLLPYAEREMSTGQSAVMLCGWGVKTGWLIPYVDKRVGGMWYLVNTCQPERFRDEYRTQNAGARLLTNTRRRDHILPVLRHFIGCRFRDEWSSRLRVLYTNRSLQRRRHLQTFILPPSMVAISAHLHIDHLLFHRRWQKLHCRRTAPVEQFADYSKTDHQLRKFRRHLKKNIYLGPRKPRRIVTFIFCAFTHLLTCTKSVTYIIQLFCLHYLLRSDRTNGKIMVELEMWANAQRDGRPAEHRWRPLFNAEKFGWRPLLDAPPIHA